MYQLLAYATALDLPGGLLIYAQGEADTASYIVKHADKRLEIIATRRGKDLDKLWSIVETLLSGCDLPARNRPHRLSGRPLVLAGGQPRRHGAETLNLG